MLMGFGLLEARAARPGPPPKEPGDPALVARQLGVGENGTLIVFVHPRCGCTPRALETLARVVRNTSGVRIHAVFTIPPNATEEWRRSTSWDVARSIPGATLHEDLGGRLAESAGATTSGHAIVLDASNRVVFAGGAVGAGHGGGAGDGSALTSLLSRTDTTPATAPSVGCELVLPDDRAPEVTP
ncbi:MAG: hypothetical protein AAF726_22850 [Planctomycetota bacterium]